MKTLRVLSSQLYQIASIANIVCSTVLVIASAYYIFHNKKLRFRLYYLFSLTIFLYYVGRSVSDRLNYVYGGRGLGDLVGSSIPGWIEFISIIFVFIVVITTIYPLLWLVFVFAYTTKITEKNSKMLKLLVTSTILLSIPQVFTFTNATWIFGSYEDLFQAFLAITGVLVLATTFGAVGYGASKLYRGFHSHTPSRPTHIVSILSLPVLGIIHRGVTIAPTLRSAQSLILVTSTFLIGFVVCFSYISYNSEILDTLPATSTVGGDTGIEAIDNPILVVNKNRNVTRANESADEIFSTGETVEGSSIDQIFSDLLDSEQDRISGYDRYKEDNRVYKIESNSIEDSRNRQLGFVIIMTDITTLQRNQQRISVLNRVLRHNVRNDLNAASGFADLVYNTENGDAGEYLERHHNLVNGLVEKGNKAREIEELVNLSPEGDRPRSVAEIINEAVEAVEVPTDVSVSLNSPEQRIVTHTNPRIIRSVIRECVQNAIEHNESDQACVNVELNRDGEICVTDNGAGIPPHETQVLSAESETSLEHGSGLGLWLIRWCMDHTGGSVNIESAEAGTTVTLSLPDTENP